MAIKLNSNIDALKTLRLLDTHTAQLSSVQERLSSGMRINRASDDAASLAVATSLSVSARLFTQGLRNINDGLSALNIAEGGARELGSVLTRMRELATQAANGTFSSQQRSAMNVEARELRNEFNRILSTTKFNGIGVLDGSMNGTTIQAGDTGQEITLSLGAFAQAGSGTFGDFTTYVQNASQGNIAADHPFVTADVNRDGNLDLIGLGTSGLFTVMLGNGNGTFRAKVQYQTGQQSLTLADINNDGVLDVLTSTSAGNNAVINLGNGDGTFRASISTSVGFTPRGINVGDFNRDGFLDLASSAEGPDNTIWISLGNGNGTFSYGTSFAAGADPKGIAVGDVNGDGLLDLVSASNTDGYISVFIGNGNGTFLARTSYQDTAGISEVRLVDINQDDILDLVYSTNSTSLYTRLGNANGTFKAQIGLPAASFSTDFTVNDFNGDGVNDILAVSHALGSYSVLLNNGDGTFRLSHTAATPNLANGVVVSGDFNSDGIADIAVTASNTSTTDVALGNSQALLQGFSLTTRDKALSTMPVIDTALTLVNQQLGVLGAQQSRLGHAASHLRQMRDAYVAANSRIMDADIAQDTATLVASKIRQETAVALLSQINESSALMIKLLLE